MFKVVTGFCLVFGTLSADQPQSQFLAQVTPPPQAVSQETAATQEEPLNIMDPRIFRRGLPGGEGEFKPTPEQRELIGKLITLWETKGGNCQKFSDLPGGRGLLTQLRESFSPEQRDRIKKIDESYEKARALAGESDFPYHMLELWEKFTKRYPKTAANREMVKRNTDHWEGVLKVIGPQIDAAFELNRSLSDGLYVRGLSVGYCCCTKQMCADGVMSVPIVAMSEAR